MGKAANNIVLQSNIGVKTQEVNPNDIKPVECSSLDLTAIFQGSGTINGGSGNDLILGSSTSDSLLAFEGDDCLVGGAGDDHLDGGDGTDICIGGDGTNTFINCETEIN